MKRRPNGFFIEDEMPSSFVKVELKCRVTRGTAHVCVAVDRIAPEPLRCTPGGPAVAIDGPRLCTECRTMLEGNRLSDLANQHTRRGWSEWERKGAVVITC